MTEREEAPDEFAHSNPAFCALVTHWAAKGFEEEAASNDPGSQWRLQAVWAMSILALVSPNTVRAKLPKKANAKISLLFDSNADWRASIAEAVESWAPSFWRGIRYGRSTGILEISSSGLRATGSPQVPTDLEAIDLRSKAIVLGRLLAKEGSDDRIALAMGLVIERDVEN